MVKNGGFEKTDSDTAAVTPGRVAQAAPAGKGAAHHPHPVQPKSLVRTEKAVTSVKPGTEGCGEHYNVREVVTDLNFAPGELHPSVTAANLLKTMVIGEALAKPRFKYPFSFKK